MARSDDPGETDGRDDTGPDETDDAGEPPEVSSEEERARTDGETAEDEAAREGRGKQALVALAALGVVFGDLGTSTIYSLHTVFTGGESRPPANTASVLGILSLVFWTLIIVVSVKYLTFVLRADNRGEGGTFALIALLRPWRHIDRISRRTLVLVGLAGAAMLYAGVMITPAISILSAVEGLKIVSPGTSSYVIPVTIVILVLLFAVQHFGSERVGAAFGPIMALWFLAIAGLGVYSIVRDPQVIVAVNPVFAVEFFLHDGVTAFLILFAIFLVTTGAEALYADIGHFGRGSIRRLWFFFVLPALLLAYFGQGATLLRDPKAAEQPFYHLIPSGLLLPMVVLATMATIIASQAAITGAFSMTREAGRLGMMPHAHVVQTSEKSSGQVYVPIVNWSLMVAAILLVLLFQSSNRLASTYGISISTAMVVTTILAYVVARERGGWSRRQAVPALVGFLVVDVAYFASNVLRIPHGGWFPVVVAAMIFTVMSTWRRGGELVTRRTGEEAKTIDEFVDELRRDDVARVDGTAVFVTPWLEHTPPALTHHIRLSRALQRRVVLLTVLSDDVPRTNRDERIELDDLSHGIHRVVLHYGYMQHPDVPADLAACEAEGLKIDLETVTYYVEHDSPFTGRGRRRGMSAWRDRLYGVLTRNSRDVTAGYRMPDDRVVDLGMRVRI